jgi:hypothetical protein
MSRTKQRGPTGLLRSLVLDCAAHLLVQTAKPNRSPPRAQAGGRLFELRRAAQKVGRNARRPRRGLARLQPQARAGFHRAGGRGSEAENPATFPNATRASSAKSSAISAAGGSRRNPPSITTWAWIKSPSPASGWKNPACFAGFTPQRRGIPTWDKLGEGRAPWSHSMFHS